MGTFFVVPLWFSPFSLFILSVNRVLQYFESNNLSYPFFQHIESFYRLIPNIIVFLPDQIPYVESGTYVAYNNEKGGVIRSLSKDGFIDLDSQVRGIPEWISAKAMVDSWLADAIIYELWVGSDGTSAHKIYYSDLAWPLGKILYLKQVHVVKQILGITKDNAERREEEVI